jgi:hypothetical protein
MALEVALEAAQVLSVLAVASTEVQKLTHLRPLRLCAMEELYQLAYASLGV